MRAVRAAGGGGVKPGDTAYAVVTDHPSWSMLAWTINVYGEPVAGHLFERRAYAQMKAIADAPKPSSEASDLERGSESRVLLRDRNGTEFKVGDIDIPLDT